MITILRKKLAMLLISVLSTVVACTALATLVVSERQLELNEWTRLEAQADRITQDVRVNDVIQTTELAKTEVANGLVIFISDAGGPIPFRGGWQSTTDREILLLRAATIAPNATGDWSGTVVGEHGERYLAAIRRINDYRNVRTVVVLLDMREFDAQRRVQRLLYAGIAIVALVVIALFCWYFTGRATQPIRKTHEEQNQFVSAASHELRTPLQVIRINAEALKLEPSDTTPFIDQILKELTHMSSLAEDLLLLTTASDRMTAKGSPVEIDELIRNAVECHAAVAQQKEIQLHTRFPPEALPLIEGNEAVLRRALNVLIDNAICYTPPSGHVTVLAEVWTQEIAIIVEDDGPGITPEHHERIFERFYRVEQSRTDRAHSGLGLSVAKSIVENHGGRLTYSPIQPHGSRFSIILPCVGSNGGEK